MTRKIKSLWFSSKLVLKIRLFSDASKGSIPTKSKKQKQKQKTSKLKTRMKEKKEKFFVMILDRII